MHKQFNAASNDIFGIQKRDIRVLSKDEVSEVGGGMNSPFIGCTLMGESSALTPMTPEVSVSSMICLTA